MEDSVWKTRSVADLFVNTVRGSIPMAAEQITVMRHLVRGLAPHFRTLLDLGCGDGILGHAMLDLSPEADATFLDFSGPFLAMARNRLAATPYRADFVLQDYGQRGWTGALAGKGGFDLIVSGFSIHHQPDPRKREIYAELFGLLNPGGLFLNLEHVLPGAPDLSALMDALFVDGIHQHELRKGGTRSREALEDEYMRRPDKAANILAPIEIQCAWLRELGYANVDCYFKIFELGLFGGQKPKA
jgi:SAM-dependent methyltransferase